MYTFNPWGLDWTVSWERGGRSKTQGARHVIVLGLLYKVIAWQVRGRERLGGKEGLLGCFSFCPVGWLVTSTMIQDTIGKGGRKPDD